MVNLRPRFSLLLFHAKDEARGLYGNPFHNRLPLSPFRLRQAPLPVEDLALDHSRDRVKCSSRPRMSPPAPVALVQDYHWRLTDTPQRKPNLLTVGLVCISQWSVLLSFRTKAKQCHWSINKWPLVPSSRLFPSLVYSG